MKVLTEVMPQPRMREFVIAHNPKKQPTMGLEFFINLSSHRMMQYPFVIQVEYMHGFWWVFFVSPDFSPSICTLQELLNYTDKDTDKWRELDACLAAMLQVSDAITEKQRIKSVVDYGYSLLDVVRARRRRALLFVMFHVHLLFLVEFLCLCSG